MYSETIDNFSEVAKVKFSLLKNNTIGYIISSILAGIYVGFGIVLIFAIGAPLFYIGSPFLKFIMGISFGVALTLVIFAGSELYTGNTMIMTYGVLKKKVSIYGFIFILLLSWIGNLIGGLFIGYLAYISGITTGMSELLEKVGSLKVNLPIHSLIIRGFLCNMLVCLAIWMSGRTKDDGAKIFLIFWCLFAFIGSGLEHSIANMTLISMGIFEAKLSWTSFFYNLFWVTIGNTIAGIFLSLSYELISIKKE